MKYFAAFLLVGAHCGAVLPAHAQHLRIFACAIANDSAGAFMGGSSNGSGLYQSDDTGKTWKHLGWDNIKCYSMDMVQSSNGRILYEATGLGVLRSTDSGMHWKQLTDWRVSEAMDVAVNQKNPEEIYIATAHGPWRSEDGGKTWRTLLRGLNEPFTFFAHFISGDTIVVGGWSANYYREKSSSAWKKIIRPIGQPLEWMKLIGNPLFIGDTESIAGTLERGVIIFRNLFSKKYEIQLPGRQIWTLKSFLVTP